MRRVLFAMLLVAAPHGVSDLTWDFAEGWAAQDSSATATVVSEITAKSRILARGRSHLDTNRRQRWKAPSSASRSTAWIASPSSCLSSEGPSSVDISKAGSRDGNGCSG